MEINEIIEHLKYYTPELPRKTLKQALEHKEEITPKLIEMLKYTKDNLEKIFYGEDGFFGYTYAYFLLAEFKEQKAFPYLIDLLYKDEEIIDYIIGDDFPGYVPRLLASTYNGDDKALFDIIENNQINEFVRCSTLQTFAILYLYGVKDREFVVNYLKRLLDQKEEKDNSYLHEEIIDEVCNLKLTELTENVEKILYVIENKEEREEIRNRLRDDSEINRNIYPLKPFYEYIYDTVGIMEEWDCFSYVEEEEFKNSDDYKVCQYIIQKREDNYIDVKIDIGRNDLCYCGSGKKYKKCCLNKNSKDDLERLNSIDEFVCRAEWYLGRGENKKGSHLLRIAWFDVQDICKSNNIKSISEYDEKYDGYDSLLNWIQTYEDILAMSDEEDKLYERLKLWNTIEDIFELDNENELYWKERAIREKANTEFRLGNEEKAMKMIEDYLKTKPNWIWGYIEMADWYDDEGDLKHYDLEKAKEILLKAERIEKIEEIDVIYERLWSIYRKLSDENNTKIYATKIGGEEC
ncbi:MAG: DUF1186 domain-containing protein [Clostridia bacterium]|nr:DUF1186 domain-containing protein [Clostridia bacterium]